MENIAEHMQGPAERVVETSKDGAVTPPGGFATRLWQRLVELWIFLTILAFFLIRVLGTHSTGRFLSSLARRHP